MKIVSFEISKALKAVGYPQIGEYWYDRSGLCCYSASDLDELQNYYYIAPTYLEVWLWLWRYKHNFLECVYKEGRFFNYKTSYSYADPEEAIIAAIEYLVNVNLIK